jgi:hypothetical protein
MMFKSDNFNGNSVIFCWIWIGLAQIEVFCSNMDLSDHAQILRTGDFVGEEFREKSLNCRKLAVFEIFEFKVNEFP